MISKYTVRCVGALLALIIRMRSSRCCAQVSGDGLWYLFLNTSAAASQDLPISIHALETRLVDGVARTDFVSHKLAIAMTEMERLTLDHVSSIHSAADSESACASK